ncbi:MAG TPA: hypothetical protein VFN34_00030 [Ornithinibacter sp.]|nr:hypothetical protein [Ornithinibacter sp.]
MTPRLGVVIVPTLPRAVAGGAEEVADAVRRAADLGSTSVGAAAKGEPDLEGFVRSPAAT